MGSYGIKVAKPGFDITTTDERNLAFTSKYNTLKVFAQGAITIPAGNTGTITHNLGYIPTYFLQGETSPTTDVFYAAHPTEWNSTINGTDLQIVAPASAGNYDFYYYIFIDEGT